MSALARTRRSRRVRGRVVAPHEARILASCVDLALEFDLRFSSRFTEAEQLVLRELACGLREVA